MAVARPSPPFDALTVHASPRWIRGELDGETVVDSTRALLVWTPGKLVPFYAFPRQDIATERVPPDATQGLDDPDLNDYLALAWDAPDHWYEEDEEIFVHPRNPFHRVDAMPSSRRVRLELNGHTLADSTRPVLLFETGLPTRSYLPHADFDASLLRDSATRTDCPYKGTASYHDLALRDRSETDLLWCYPEPLTSLTVIAGLLAPFNERVDLFVDGVAQERPRTPWSR